MGSTTPYHHQATRVLNTAQVIEDNDEKNLSIEWGCINNNLVFESVCSEVGHHRVESLTFFGSL
jgi:hypothetical protein